MTYKSIIQILLILAIISTICISIMKPKMHKPVMVLNSQFSVEHDDGINIDEKNIAVMVQDTQVNQGGSVGVQNEGGINFVEPKIEDIQPVGFENIQTGNISNVKTQPVNNAGFNNKNTNLKTTPAKVLSNTAKPTQTVVNSTPFTNKSAVANSQLPKIDLNKIVDNNQKILNTSAQTPSAPAKTNNAGAANAPVAATKPQTTQVPAQTQNTQPPSIRVNTGTTSNSAKPVTVKTQSQPVVLTAQQEEIEWNKWRSNLNNQIMRDSKLPTMPNGIIFKYKFTVDKYGKVSNVQTSSTTPGYTPYAIQFIAPVIRSYQGRAILNFPVGSKREYTEVSGAWKISNSSKLSTPDDFHDVEKVKK